MIYSPEFKGPATIAIGAQSLKNDYKTIAIASTIILSFAFCLVCTGLYLGERRLAETEIYTA